MLEQLIIVVFIVFISIYIVYKFKTYKSLLYIVIPIHIILDIGVLHFGGSDALSIMPVFRIIYILCIYTILLFSNAKLDSILIVLTFFIFYIVGLIVFRLISIGASFEGLEFLLRTSLPIILVYISMHCLTKIDDMKAVNISVIISLIIFIGYLLLANIFDLGKNIYYDLEQLDEGVSLIYTGLFLGNTFNTLAYLVLLLPLVYKYNTNINGLYLNVLLVLGFLFLILTFRRSALGITIFAYIVYAFTIFKYNNKNISYLILILITIIFIYPFILPFLQEIINLRGDRGTNPFSLETIQSEGRTNELFYILNKVTFAESIMNFMFGYSFSTSGVYPFAPTTRELHSDIAVLLYTVGYMGMFLYIIFHLTIIQTYYKYRRYSYNNILNIMFWVILVTSIMLSYSGRLTVFSFRSIIFLYIGMIIGILKCNYYNDEDTVCS